MRLILIICSFVFSILAYGNEKPVTDWTTLKFKTLSFQLPKSWKTTDDLFGLEFAVLSPYMDGKRDALTITALELKNKIDQNKILEKKNEYRTGREIYIKKKQGEVLSLQEPEEIKKEKMLMYQMSVKYKVKENFFNEQTFLIQCKNELFHVKFMSRDKDSKNISRIVDQFIKSVACASNL